METSGLFTALVFGAAIGGLGRLVVPGRQHISLLATVLGVADTPGIDWIEPTLQVGLAGAGVTALANRARPKIHH
ncbi:GlsB/YeaQ/YmgE family stress response membrane protein [Lentzea jiangxiensis]|uniref:Uncharacterized protein n=1 Tax=Lentzea jiangxiensis TaxID=641025 RepID=A0A1H0QWB9_9PSEU|nr:GlsB/YeaQ/YmgE family stress response membrane protein [Lentzea jiangxiensis]SDP21435.1 hypothetical protein SAMN05421507_10639 [Lentzea jiangxiensis]